MTRVSRGVSGHAGLAAACLATCAVPLATAGLAAAGSRRAVLLAVAAGLADAAIAVVTMAFSHAVGGGLTGMAGSWATYALMLGGPCSLLLTQTAYQAGRPMITLPVIAVVTPVASLAAGNLLLGESAQLGVLGGTVVALAVLVTSAGLVVLARLATGQPVPAGGQGSSVILPARPASGSRSGPGPRTSRRCARRAPVTRARVLLGHLVRALSQAETADEVARVMAEEGAVAAGAEFANIAVLDVGATTAHLYNASSLSDDVTRRHAVVACQPQRDRGRKGSPGQPFTSTVAGAACPARRACHPTVGSPVALTASGSAEPGRRR